MVRTIYIFKFNHCLLSISFIAKFTHNPNWRNSFSTSIVFINYSYCTNNYIILNDIIISCPRLFKFSDYFF